MFFKQQRKRTRSSSRGEERALTNHRIVKSLLLKQLCLRFVFRHHRFGGAGEGEEAPGDGEVSESAVRGDRRPLRIQGY